MVHLVLRRKECQCFSRNVKSIPVEFWCGLVVAEIYKKKIKKVVQKAFIEIRKISLLEDESFSSNNSKKSNWISHISHSHSSLTSSTCTHSVMKICDFPSSYNFLSDPLPLQYSHQIFYVCKISWKHWSHPFHSGTSTVDPLITLYTQCVYSVSLYSQNADPTWVNFTFSLANLCDATADHYLGFPKVYFLTFALKSLLPF